MTNLDAAMALADAGVPVFPVRTSGEEVTSDGEIVPLHKRPFPLFQWKARASALRSEVDAMWRRYPDAAPAIHLGKTDLWVLDCDAPKADGQQHGIEWFRSICEDHDFDLSSCPIVVTPSGGWHVYFVHPPGGRLGNGRGSLPPKAVCGVDVRGDGGYVLAPGATIDIGGYSLMDGPDLSAAAEPPQWLSDILMSRRVAATVTAPAIMPRGAVTSREEEYAATAMDDECRAIAATGKGGRNVALNDGAFKVGTLVGAGWISYGAARGALLRAVDGWTDPRKTVGTLDRALRAGMGQPRAPLEDIAGDGDLGHGSALAAALVTSPPTPDAARWSADAPATAAPADSMLSPPGLVGRIAEWICATARRPQPTLALGAAIVIVGTAGGRLFAGPTGAALQLYTLGIAESGYGKDHPLKSIDRMLMAAGMEQHLGPPQFSSMQAVLKMLRTKPLCVCPMDEFGAFIARINSRRASSHEMGISSVLRSAWSAQFDYLGTPETATQSSFRIPAPAISIYGTSPPDEFFAALDGGDVTNGFLNRFLLIESLDRPEDRTPAASGQVPDDIIHGLKAIYAHGSTGLQLAQRNSSDLMPEPIPVSWGPGAEAAYRAFGLEVERRRDADGGKARSLLVRTHEMAIRLATIRAIGRRPDAAVSAEDMAWGIAVADWSARTMVRLASDRMAETEHQAQAQKVLRLIRQRGEATGRDLARNLTLRKRDLDDILSQLVDGGLVAIERAAPEGRGRPTVRYVALAAG